MGLSGTPLTETSAFTAAVYPPQANSAVQSNDVAAGEQALANRTRYLYETKSGVYHHPTPGTSVSPSYTNATNAFTEIAAVTFVDPTTEEVAVGDVVEITFTCTAQSTTEASLIALTVQQDSDPSGVEIVGARVRIPAGGLDVPVSLAASFVVTEAGGLIARAEGAKDVLGGSLTVVEAYRLEARRVRPTEG